MSVTINASTSTGLVQSADTSGEIELQSNGTTALKVNTNEGIQILNCLGVGNATPSTSGAGITFPATQSASTDANTLDDYEEGTWTPTFTASGATFTYDVQTGRYTKIGNIVHATCYVGTSISGGASSNVQVTGLPFTVSNVSNYYPAVTVGQIWQIDYPTGAIQLIAFADPNTTNIALQFAQDNNNTVNLVGANIKGSPVRTYLMLNITYQV